MIIPPCADKDSGPWDKLFVGSLRVLADVVSRGLVAPGVVVSLWVDIKLAPLNGHSLKCVLMCLGWLLKAPFVLLQAAAHSLAPFDASVIDFRSAFPYFFDPFAIAFHARTCTASLLAVAKTVWPQASESLKADIIPEA